MNATTQGLPSGTVTFLFTDIEGSTRLLRELGDLYDEVLSLHHRVLRDVWTRHRGVEVNTEGDAFFVAFAHAVDALHAAVEAQQTLATTEWPGGRPMKVRMGMHTGYARPVDDDYRALAVNQAARVVDAAHGGQIFATDEVVAFLVDRPSSDVETTPLGRFRVRDFDEPITLHQVGAPDVPAVDKPPRVRPADRHNLIRATTSLVDRVREQRELGGLLKPGALVTLIGPGGAGKTRLSLEVGFNTVDRWPDGIWFVELAPLSNGDVIASAVAEAVNAPAVSGNDALTDLIAHLADRNQLVVLDNCEHLLDSVAVLAHRLLQECPRLGLLVTSRVPLGLLGEIIYRLEPLASLDADSPAVRLYLDRTGHDPKSDLTEIVGLCRELDGLPLAIEIAATRAHLLTPSEMQDRMRRGVRVLSSRVPTRADRPRSIDRLLDWTLDILPHHERLALTRLAVCAGGFDGSLAETLLAEESITPAEVPELVWSLVDWSLARRDIAAGATRYSLLSTVRAHVLQRSNAADLVGSRRRLANALSDRIGPHRALSRTLITELGTELANIRGVVAHLEVPDDVARPLVWSIGQYHEVKGMHRTGLTEIERCIEERPGTGPDLVALLTLQSDLHLRLGETTDAERITSRAERIADDVGCPEWDDMGLVRTRGELALRSGDPVTAARLAASALDAGPATPRGRARLWNLVAIAQHALGDVAASCAALDQCITAEKDAGLETFLANTYGNYAEALLQLGDLTGGARHQLAALELGRELGQSVVIAYSCMVAARFAVEEDAPDKAVRLQTGADAIVDDAGVLLYPGDAEKRTTLLDTARASLDGRAFDRAVEAGLSTPIDHLADEAAAVLRHRAESGTSSRKG